MPYFPGFTSFTNEEPFSDTLFVEIRKRLILQLLNKINETIALYGMDIVAVRSEEQKKPEDKNRSPSSKDNIDPHETNGSLIRRQELHLKKNYRRRIFGPGKTANGLNKIRTKLSDTGT